MDNSERFEQLIAFVGAQLPKPVEEHQTDDGSFIFTGGEPAEVIVQVTESTVLVAAFVAIPEGGDASATEPQPVGELHWRLLPETAVMNALSALDQGLAGSASCDLSRLSRLRPDESARRHGGRRRVPGVRGGAAEDRSLAVAIWRRSLPEVAQNVLMLGFVRLR